MEEEKIKQMKDIQEIFKVLQKYKLAYLPLRFISQKTKMGNEECKENIKLIMYIQKLPKIVRCGIKKEMLYCIKEKAT